MSSGSSVMLEGESDKRASKRRSVHSLLSFSGVGRAEKSGVSHSVCSSVDGELTRLLRTNLLRDFLEVSDGPSRSLGSIALR